ncbi:metal ABC transporter permease [Breoghania sp. L-A4]|uniref:metal ABC transporter permease n=1 Tax=Breoghania sp. L-A4 TaxID=2304600 RepID=UPI000E35C2D2|nr:metal ABC transporter permease [Breoghania sp. L-A4]AXS39610.1 metal ABC transporter permease [Breoghania sp. L-A4]
MPAILQALFLSAGYNTTLVCVGAGLLGAAAGAIGVFVLLRKRSLLADAMSHATLPGVAIGFMAGVALFGDGRNLPLMLMGAAMSAGLGVLAVDWIRNNTRLSEDTAIGTVLSTFFALGMVLLTVIQEMDVSGQAGLEGFLLGATAGMLKGEALMIAAAAACVALAALAFMKQFSLVCFDADYAQARGWSVRRIDLLMLGLLLAVVVIGLKTVGLVLIIALAIIPPVAARFWTDRLPAMVAISSGIGAAGSYVGAAISSIAPNLPTGGVIVLVLFFLFLVSMLVSPVYGLVAAILRHRRFQRVVHERQGLLALARGEPVFDPLTIRVLGRRGFLRGDGSPTPEGLSAGGRMSRDQALWNRYREDYPEDAHALADWSLKPIDDVLPRDLVSELEHKLAPAAAGAPGPRGPRGGALA